MATLTLKNIPEPLLERLRMIAESNRRSLNQQTIHLLEEVVKSSIGVVDPQSERDAVDDQLAAIRKLAGRWRSKKTLAAEIQDIYRARTRGRDVKL